MRKLSLFLVIALCVMFSAGVAMAYSMPDDPAIIKKVRGTRNDMPVRVIKLGRNSLAGENETSIASGDVVIYDLTSDDTVSIALTTTSSDNSIAGIAVTAIPTGDLGSPVTVTDDLNRKNWGYYLVHGKATANITAGGTNGHASGDPFCTSSDSGKVTGIEAGDFVGDTAGVIKRATSSGGFFMDVVSTSATTAPVFVRLE